MQKFLRTLTLLALLAVPWVAQGQAPVSSYEATHGNAVYTSIYSSTTQHGDATATYVDIQVPFAMTFGENSLPANSTLRAYPDGHATFTAIDGSSLNALYNSSTTTGTKFTNTPAQIYYATSGSGSNTVLTVEWRKLTTGTSSISCQMKLYPTGKVEFCYGPSSINQSSFSVSVGLKASNSDYRYFYSSWSSPSVTSTTSSTLSLSTSSSPAYNTETRVGRVFTLSVPSCVRPSTPTLTVVDHQAITVAWTGASGNFQVQYSTSSSFPDGGSQSKSVNGAMTTTLTGLDAATTYYVRVRRVCGPGEFSLWTAYDYETTEAAPCPTYTVDATHGILVDFEDLTDEVLNCFQMVHCAYSTGIVSGSGLGGSNCFVFYYTTDIPQYLISPKLNASTAFNVSFKHKNYSSSYPETFMVGYSTTTDDTSAFTWGAEITDEDVTWTSYSNSFPANTKYVAIKCTSNDQWYLFIDSVVIGNPPVPCAKPTLLPASNITGASAVLRWTETGTATQWQLVYGEAGFDHTTATPVTVNAADTVGGYALTGLNGATTYDVYVRSVCAATDLSKWSDKVSFTTACGILPVPYTENFESYTHTTSDYSSNNADIPLCWTVSPMDGDNGNHRAVHVGTKGAINGKGLVMTAGTNSCIPNNIAILPEFNMPLNQLQIAFDSKMESTSMGKLTLGYVTNASDTSTFVALEQITSTSSAQHTDYVFSGTFPAGARIAFRWYLGSSYYWVNIDNVVVSVIPNCTKPQSLATSALAATSATVTWQAGDNVNEFTIQYGTDNTFATYEETTSTTKSVTLLGLNAQTQYFVRVMGDCGTEGTSDWSNTFNFMTPCESESLPFTEDFDAFSTSDPCWRGASATTAQQVWDGASLTLTTPSSWSYASSANSGIPAGHMYENIYGSSCKSWLITPNIDLTNVSAAQLTFDAAFTAYNSATAASGFDNNATQAFMVLVSTDGGATWPEAYATKWQNEGGQHTLAELAGTEYVEQTVNLSSYVGQTIRIAFYAQSTAYGGDNNLHIDNIAVVVPPTCGNPKGLTASEVTSSSATVTWTAPTLGSPSTYQVAYGLKGFVLEEMSISDYITVETNAVTLPNLRYNTSYDIYVRSICSSSDQSLWSKVYTFTTGCKSSLTADDLPYSEDFSSYTGMPSPPYYGPSVLPGCWGYYSNGTNTAETSGSSSYYGGVAKYGYTSSYACLVANDNYLCLPAYYYNGTSTYYLPYNESRGNTRYAVMPAYNGSYNTLQLSFDYKMYNTTNANSKLYLGYVTSDTASFQTLVTYDATSSKQSVEDLELSTLGTTIPSGASLAFKWMTTYSSSSVQYCGIDNIVLKPVDQTVYLSANQTINTCSGAYAADTATGQGHYATGTRTYTFKSNTPGNVVSLSGSYDLEAGYDFLNVYYNTVADSNLIATYTGKGSFKDLKSLSHRWATEGALILQLVADNDDDFKHFGFQVTASCVCPAQDPNTVMDVVTTTAAYTWPLNPNFTYNVVTTDVPGDAFRHYTDGPATQKGVGTNPARPDILCDSISRRLDLTIYNNYNLSVSADVCERDTVEFYGEKLTATGNYTRTMTSSTGTDSTTTLALAAHTAPDVYIYYNNRNVTAPITGVCDGAALTLEGRSNNSSATFTWNDGTTETPHVVYPLNGDTVWVFSTETNYGCTSLPVSVVIGTTPVAYPAIHATDTVICRGDTVTLTASDLNNVAGVTFRWSNGATTPSITVVPTATTTYTVIATANGCDNSVSQTITVNQLPEVIITNSVPELCYKDTLTVTATSNAADYSYRWANAATTNSIVVVPEAGNYNATVTVTDGNGCVNQFTSPTVAVHPSYDRNVDAVECTPNLPYVFGNASSDTIYNITDTGVYHNTFHIAYGCDSIVTLHFSILDTAVNNTFNVLCEGTPFTFGDTIYRKSYVASVDTVISYVNTLGNCPARNTLTLTVNPVRSNAITNRVCDSLTWNDSVYTVSGTYVQHLLTNRNCDSTVTLTLTVNYSDEVNRDERVCDSLVWNFISYKDTGYFTQEFVNRYGCDSIETIHITEVNNSTYRIDDTCATSPFTWIDGETYSISEKSGYVSYVYDTTDKGCNAYAILNLTVNMPVDVLPMIYDTVCDNYTVDTVACEGGLNEFVIHENGVYNLRLYDSTGVNTIIQPVSIFIRESGNRTAAKTACAPYVHTWADGTKERFTESTMATHESMEPGACSVIEHFFFTAIPPEVRYTDTVVCSETATSFRDVDGHVFSTRGYEPGDYAIATYVDTTNPDNIAANSCPYSDTLRLTVNGYYESIKGRVVFCQGMFTYDADTNSDYYGLYTHSEPDPNHDTVITLTWDGTFNYGDINLDKTTYRYPMGDCDSVLEFGWAIFRNAVANVYETSCVSYTWKENGKTYTAETNKPYTEFRDSILTPGVHAWFIGDDTIMCDSMTYLNLVVNDTLRDTLEQVNHCNTYEFNGQTYYESHTFIQDSVLEDGCPALRLWVHTVGEPQWVDKYVVSSHPYYWISADSIISKTGVYDHNHGTSECVDMERLHFTKVDTVLVGLCDSTMLPYTTDFGFVLDTNNIDSIMSISAQERGISYYMYVVDTADVDTFITIAIAPAENNWHDYVTDACDSYKWVNGVTYTVDTVDMVATYTDVFGCERTDTLDLTLKHNGNHSDTVVTCDNYWWHANMYDSTGVYTAEYTNGEGCPSVDTLHLTINVHTPITDSFAVCDSYTYNNNMGTHIITESGEYIIARADTNGCVGVDTVKLTVNKSILLEMDTIINAASYTYNGVLYIMPANRTSWDTTIFDTLSRVNTGCDSVRAMTLRLYRGNIISESFNECGFFTWTDRTDHTYSYLTPAERIQHGGALYYDMDAQAYVMTNPIYNVYNTTPGDPDSGSVIEKYILYLTLSEAYVHDTVVDSIPMTLASYTYGTETPIDLTEFNDLGHDTVIYRQYKKGVSGYYCDSIENVTLNLYWNVDTTRRTACATDTSIVWYNVNGELAELPLTDWTDTVGKFDTNWFSYTENVGTMKEKGHVLRVIRKGIVYVNDTVTGKCDSYTWSDTKHPNYKTYHAIANQLEQDDILTFCDSIVKVHLSIDSSISRSYDVVRCDTAYDWKVLGREETADPIDTIHYTANGTYTYLIDSTVTGCPNVDTLHLTLVADPSSIDSMVVCGGYLWEVNDILENGDTNVITSILTGSDTFAVSYNYAWVNGNPCTAIDTLILTVKDVPAVTPVDTTVYGGNGTTFAINDTTFAYPTDTTIDVIYEAANGCDSVIALHLVIRDFNTDTTHALNVCGRYVWDQNGHTYEWIDTTGLHGVLYRDVTDDVNITAAPRDTVDNIIYILDLTLRESGIGYQTVDLLLSQNADGYVNIADGRVTTWDIDDFEGLDYMDDTTVNAVKDLSTGAGCDSVVYYTLNVIYNYEIDSVQFCGSEHGQSFVWEGNTYAKPAQGQRDTLEVITGAHGINERVKQMRLYTHEDILLNIFDTVCDQITFNGNIYTETRSDITIGLYYLDTIKNAQMCDTIVHLYLVVNKGSYNRVDTAGCDSVVYEKYYTWMADTGAVTDTFSAVYYESDTVNFEYLSANGCPSVDTLYLTIFKSIGKDTVVTACDEFTWPLSFGTIHGNGTTYRFANDTTIVDTSDNGYPTGGSLGCTTYDVLHLTLHNSRGTYDTVYAYEGFRYTWHGRDTIASNDSTVMYTTSQDITELYTAGYPVCNDTFHLNINIGPMITRTDEVLACHEYTWIDGNTYVYLTAEQRAAHPTALYYNATMNSFPQYNPTYTIEVEGDYDTVALLMLTLNEWLADYDTVVYPVSNVVLNYGDSIFDYSELNQAMIDSVKAGHPVATGTVLGTYNYTVHYGAPAGTNYCDDVTHLNVKVVNNYTADGMGNICATETEYQYRDSVYTAEFVDNDYDNERLVALFYELVNDDSLQNVTYFHMVNQHPLTYSTERREACNTYTWTANDSTYGEGLHDGSTKTYYGYVTATNQFGCDSVISLILKLHYDNNTPYYPAFDCDTVKFTPTHVKDTTFAYSESTVATYKWMTSYSGYSMKCESVDTVYVRVAHPEDSIFTVAACDSYTWDVNNKTYKKDTNVSKVHSRTYTDTVYGTQTVTCPVKDSLVLTINHNTNSLVADDTVCDFYATTTNFYKVNLINVSRLSNWMDADGVMPNDTSVYTDGLEFDTLYSNFGEDITEPGVYWHLYTAANGCHSIDTLKLDVNYNSNAKVYGVACDTFFYAQYYEHTVKVGTGAKAHDTTIIDTFSAFYTQSDSVLFEYIALSGCPSVDTLVFTVNHADSSTVADTLVCDSYSWTDLEGSHMVSNSTVYNFDTVVREYYATVNGCDSIVTRNVTIGHGVTYEVQNVTACGHYEWVVNDSLLGTFTESTNASYNFRNPNHGCDSVVYLRLTITEPGIFLDTTVNEATLPFVWNGNEYTESGIYRDTLGGNGECDSIAELHLTVRTTNMVNDFICFGTKNYNKYGFTFDSAALSVPGVIAGYNADSTVWLNLTVGFRSNHVVDFGQVNACESYDWGFYTGYDTDLGVFTTDTVTLTENGDYAYFFMMPDWDATCYYVDSLHLKVVHNLGVKTEVYTCGAYNWRGNEYTESGEYYFQFTDTNNCAAADTLVLTINGAGVATSFDTAACGSFVWDGFVYTESGSYSRTYGSVDDCDSVVTMNLTITDQVFDSIAKLSCGSYTWNGITYNESGTYTQTFEAENGCDSVVTLTLIVGTVASGDTAATACGSFEWFGETYTTSGVYTHTFVADETCDSVVTLTLTINQPVTSTETVTACGSYTWNDVTLTESGVYTDTLTAVNGCDSIVTLNLTINVPIDIIASVVACDSYTWFDVAYTTSGTYTHDITDANGCAATATLGLTIHNSVTNTISAQNCVSYTWNNQTYYGSGSYTQSFQTIHGCDSTVTLNLTINQPTTGSETIESCNDITWHGQTISTSGAYTYTTVNAAGCDSVVTLFFTRLQSVAVTVNATACDSYTWNGTTYTTSGTYTYNTTGASGCDSLTTLVLTINETRNTSISESACESYSWNDQEYTTSGTYQQTLTARNGCDSIVTLTLTVNHDAYSTVTDEACGSYFWNGEEYTTSGTYLYITTTTAGCDSIVTLNLTVNQPVYTNLTVTADGGYNWNGEVYTESGIYTYTTTAANGCDSTVTLDLTVNPIYNVILVSANETMGTVSESGAIVENGYFTAVATPKEGYEFVEWKNGNVTVSTNATYVFQVTEDVTLTAVFQVKTVGIEDVDMDNVTIYSSNSTIYVKGVEGHDVYVYDVNGRMMDRQLNAADAIEFRMTATGVYLVKVGNAPAKRVVVVR